MTEVISAGQSDRRGAERRGRNAVHKFLGLGKMLGRDGQEQSTRRSDNDVRISRRTFDDDSFCAGVDLAANGALDASPELENRTKRNRPSKVDLEVTGHHRSAEDHACHALHLVESGGENSAVNDSGSTLVLLRDFEASGHFEALTRLETHRHPGRLIVAATEALRPVLRQLLTRRREEFDGHGHGQVVRQSPGATHG